MICSSKQLRVGHIVRTPKESFRVMSDHHMWSSLYVCDTSFGHPFLIMKIFEDHHDDKIRIMMHDGTIGWIKVARKHRTPTMFCAFQEVGDEVF